MYRIIVERSSMRNNDELVYFSSQVDYSTAESVEQLTKELHKKKDALGVPQKLVLCRKVFQEEIEAGLKTSYRGWGYDENPPRITRFLDSFFRLKEDYAFAKKHWKPGFTLSQWIAEYAASNYYDCMSSGCPEMDLVILQHLCQNQDISLQEQVYPGKGQEGEDWYTLEDFLQDLQKREVPKFQEVVEDLNLIKQLTFEE